MNRIDTSTIESLVRELQAAGLEAARDEPMSKHTSFRLGGPADVFAVVRTIAELETAVQAAWARNLPLFVFGRGSNLLVADRGIRGVVVKNSAERYSIERPSPPSAETPIEVVADSGTRLPTLALQLARRGLAGLEWATAIPGSVGGGVVQNAGAYGGDIAQALISVVVLERDGRRVEYPARDLDLAYRHSSFRSGPRASRDRIILSARFAVRAEPSEDVVARAHDFNRRRRAGQPPGASAGSIFKNPPANYAGRLVEQAGLKGYQIGGALISPKHGNFIVNKASATAADVRSLIELARTRVLEASGIELEPEVEFAGVWDQDQES